MKLGAGWLSPITPPEDRRAVTFAEVAVPRWSEREQALFPTRCEEFGFVWHELEHWPRGSVLDAGAGYNDEIHLLPYILGNMGYDVTAVDANAASLDMPKHSEVERILGDITLLDLPDDSFDVWCCISVLEHMRESDKALALHEAFRVLRSGGLALLTTDHTPPEETTEWFKSAGFLIGPVAPPFGPMLAPPVSYIVAQRPL